MHPSHSSTLSRCTTLGSTTYTLTAFGLVVLFLSYYKLFAPLETRYEVSLGGATYPHSPSGVQSAGEVPGAIRSRESSAELLKFSERRGAGASFRDARNATSTAQQGSGPFLIGTNSPPGGSGRQEMPYVVLGVATSPKNEGHRSWIRRTWCAQADSLFYMKIAVNMSQFHTFTKQIIHLPCLFTNVKE